MDIRKAILLTILLTMTALSQNSEDSIQINGQYRSFIVHVPPSAMNPPLVVNMHGLTMTASLQQMYTGFDDIADREGFVVVYPDGLENSWDLMGSTDVTFISDLIDTCVLRYGIDENRVYATGFSMGGFMSYRLACALSEKITAIAPVAGTHISYNCNPQRPVPVLHIHGTTDSTVSFSNAASSISFWAEKNGCPLNPQITDPYPENDPISSVYKEQYTSCDEESDVILLAYEELGHVWPGAYGAGSDIDANEEIWSFLKDYSKDRPGTKLARSGKRKTRHPHSSPRLIDGTIHIESSRGIEEITIFNMQGKHVRTYAIAAAHGGTSINLPFKAASKGVYIVSVQNGTRRLTSRIIVER